MKIRKLCTVLVFLAWVSNASAVTETEGQVTLYPPRATGTYSEGNACFSFKAGALKKHANGQWDLGYGFANIGGNDLVYPVERSSNPLRHQGPRRIEVD